MKELIDPTDFVLSKKAGRRWTEAGGSIEEIPIQFVMPGSRRKCLSACSKHAEDKQKWIPEFLQPEAILCAMRTQFLAASLKNRGLLVSQSKALVQNLEAPNAGSSGIALQRHPLAQIWWLMMRTVTGRYLLDGIKRSGLLFLLDAIYQDTSNRQPTRASVKIGLTKVSLNSTGRQIVRIQ